MSRKAKFIPMRILSPKNAGTILTQNRTMVKPDPEMPISPMAGAKVRMHHLPTGELVWEGKSDSQGYYYPKNLKEHEEYLPVGIHQPRNFAAVASGPVQPRPRLNASAINCTIGKPFQWKPRVHGHNVQVTLVGGELPEGMEWSQEFGLISEHVSGVAGVYNLEFQAATKYGPLLYKVALVNTLLPLRVPLRVGGGRYIFDLNSGIKPLPPVVVGGLPPYSVSVESGHLPDGVSVDSGGRLKGVPVGVGGEATLRVEDANGDSVDVPMAVYVHQWYAGSILSQIDFENGYVDGLTGDWVPSEEGVELKKIAGFGYGTSAELTGGYIHHAHTEAYELPRDYTLEFRASFPDLDEGVLVSTRPDGLGHAPFLMEIGAEGQVVVRMSRNGGSWAATMESEPLEIDTEYFIAVGRNGDDLSLFINGETVDTAILDGQIYTNEAGMTLGADGDGSNSKNMLLDNFRLTQEPLEMGYGGAGVGLPPVGLKPPPNAFDPYWSLVQNLVLLDGAVQDALGAEVTFTKGEPQFDVDEGAYGGLTLGGVFQFEDPEQFHFGAEDFTLEMRFKVVEDIGSGRWDKWVHHREVSPSTGVAILIEYNQSSTTLMVRWSNFRTGATSQTVTIPNLNDGRWHNMVFGRQGGNMVFILDGDRKQWWVGDTYALHPASVPLQVGDAALRVDWFKCTRGVFRYEGIPPIADHPLELRVPWDYRGLE